MIGTLFRRVSIYLSAALVIVVGILYAYPNGSAETLPSRDGASTATNKCVPNNSLDVIQSEEEVFFVSCAGFF